MRYLAGDRLSEQAHIFTYSRLPGLLVSVRTAQDSFRPSRHILYQCFTQLHRPWGVAARVWPGVAVEVGRRLSRKYNPSKLRIGFAHTSPPFDGDKDSPKEVARHIQS